MYCFLLAYHFNSLEWESRGKGKSGRLDIDSDFILAICVQISLKVATVWSATRASLGKHVVMGLLIGCGSYKF